MSQDAHFRGPRQDTLVLLVTGKEKLLKDAQQGAITGQSFAPHATIPALYKKDAATVLVAMSPNKEERPVPTAEAKDISERKTIRTVPAETGNGPSPKTDRRYISTAIAATAEDI